ncbi:apolipoprotein N-acyltransferase [Streptomyces verrucosisporus]|uniref:apolipoprotein N-acyltransferase n=1 Tax=Streptomyces verrucosisporus TaxID=1695161 RepID=UPI0019CFCA9F|nr:apolipoprotein N-acyltransferase [Streptomyces verrucosisporus]MBN3929554.1 apolipoprotein N-acyltransferase [Streptomyces verrucosisporus]
MPSGPETTAEAETGGAAAGHPDEPQHRRTTVPAGTPARAAGEAGDAPAPAAGEAGARPAPRLPVRLAGWARREAWRTAAAAVSGVALAAAFPPYDVWPLSVAAVAVLALLTRGRTARQGAWLGLAMGLPFFLVLLKWLHVIGWDAVFGLSLVESLFFVPMGAGLAATSRLPLWPLWGACLWVAEEWARDRIPFGGFPWGRLAFAVTDSPFLPLAALGGAPLVTFAVALTGGLLAAAAVRGAAAVARRRGAEETDEGDGTGSPSAAGSRTARPALAAAGAAALAAAVTAAGLAVPVRTAAADTVRIAVVQGNVQQPGMDFLGRPMLILNNHVEATLKLAEDVEAGLEERPDLVIWPENASDLDPHRYPQAYDAIDRAARAVGVPVLVGALVDHPEREGYVENQGIVWDPETGPGASYTKQHPVPFGEYVPYRDQLSKVITRLQRVPRDFWPGQSTGVMDVGPARLGDVICFEVAYDEIVRDTVNDGARALVIQTNNATYGNTGQPEQQLVMSRLRAVEHGRAVVTAATSGISAVVAPDGTIGRRTEEFTQDVVTADLPLRDETTLSDRIGPAPEWVLAMVGLLSCAAAFATGRRGRVHGVNGTDEKRRQQ